MALLLLALSLIFSGFVDALPYDYSATIECLTYPETPQYNGGIITNPEINDGLNGWEPYGNATIDHRSSSSVLSNEGRSNNFAVARNRNRPNSSISQKINLGKDLLYVFSAWIQVSGPGNAVVSAVFETGDGSKSAGTVLAESGCWSMLKGGLTIETYSSGGEARLYFHSNDTTQDLWIDSVSLQPFTLEQWRSHQDHSIDKVRKSKVRFKTIDANGNPRPGAKISITPTTNLQFPIGAAINRNILTNPSYQTWFTKRFTATTFENEMKWYSTEPIRGRTDYSLPDSMLDFARRHGINVRGHNILWDDPHYQPYWLNSLSPRDLLSATHQRIISLVARYRGQVLSWDVVNENLHFSYFEQRLGRSASCDAFKLTRWVDRGRSMLFLNDYNTIEHAGDGSASPGRYVAKVREVKGAIGDQRMRRGVGRSSAVAIGLEGHFGGEVNLPYMRAALDVLAITRSPIWITELDVEPCNNQAEVLEQVLREAHAHPAVKGIVIWAAWRPEGCYRMCLTDGNFNNLPTGNVVDKLLREWGRLRDDSEEPVVVVADGEGFVEVSLVHGEYEVKAACPGVNGSAASFDGVRSRRVRVESNENYEGDDGRAVNDSVMVVPLFV